MVDLAPAPTPLGNFPTPPGPVWKWAAVSRFPSAVLQGDLSDAGTRKLHFDLMAPATCSLTLPGKSAQLQLVTELRSDLVAFRWSRTAGFYVPYYRGVIFKSKDAITPTQHVVTLTSTDYRGILTRLTLRTPATYTTIDQAVIFATLIARAHAPTGTAFRLGLTYAIRKPTGGGLPGVGTGVLRTRAYQRGQVIGTALDQLSVATGGTSAPGFDWSVEPAPTAAITSPLVASLWYPHRGVTQANFVLEYGRNVSAVTRTVDTKNLSSYVLVTGKTAATTWAEAFGPGWTTPAANPEGAFMTVQSQSSVTVAQSLQQAANGAIKMYGAIIPVYKLKLMPGSWSPVTAWLGDSVRLLIKHGRLNVDTVVRITAVTITIDANGTEQVTITAGLSITRYGHLWRQLTRRLAYLEAR